MKDYIMFSSSSSSSSGVSFIGLLTLLFIALKLTGYITWPWVWVLSPIWISAILTIIIIFIVFVLLISKSKGKK